MSSITAAEASTRSAEVVEPMSFRRAMAEFASGVTVITASDGNEPVGFACQSFSSVSLDPPLVLFCVDRGSRTWPRMRAAGRFCVNILAVGQDDLCARFGSRDGQRFNGLDWELSPWRTPSLPGVLGRIHADVQEVHEAGDHDVVVGRVVALERLSEDGPMIFFRGRFGLDAQESDAGAGYWLDGWI